MYKCTPLENGVHFFIGEKALGKDPFAPVSKERKIMIIQKEKIQEEVAQVVETVKKTNPMAGSITNSVTINFVANAQIAVGGSAAMVYLPDEAEVLAEAGGATYLNAGTLLPIYEDSFPSVAKNFIA